MNGIVLIPGKISVRLICTQIKVLALSVDSRGSTSACIQWQYTISAVQQVLELQLCLIWELHIS